MIFLGAFKVSMRHYATLIATVIVTASMAGVTGCNANYIHFKGGTGGGSITLLPGPFTPGFTFAMNEGSELLIRRGGAFDNGPTFAEVMNGENGENEEGESATGGVPPILPQPDSK